MCSVLRKHRAIRRIRGRSETLVTSSSLSLCMDGCCLWQRCRIKELQSKFSLIVYGWLLFMAEVSDKGTAKQDGAVGLRLRVSHLEPRL
jgi:hypothetical protein